MSDQQTYRIKLSDGREFNVTTEGGPPSEQDVLAGLQPQSSQLDTPAPPTTKPSKWSDRLGLNLPTESVAKGFLRGSGAAAVDMLQGAASNVMHQAKDLGAGLMQVGDTEAGIQSNPAAEIGDRAVPDMPDTVAGKVGYVIPTAAELALGGGKAGVAAIDALPSTARAGRNFEKVMAAAGDMPVNVDSTRAIAERIQELASHGGKMPKAAKDFLKTVPAGGPSAAAMDYRTARDFASNLSKLSSGELQKLAPSMLREVATMSAELNKSIAETAKHAGMLDEYQSAMKEYARAMRLTKAAKVAAAGAVGTAAAALGAKKLTHVLGELY